MPKGGIFRKAHSRTGSFSSDEGSNSGDALSSTHPLEPPILVYHESARSIVFRDHLRRVVEKSGTAGLTDHKTVTSNGNDWHAHHLNDNVSSSDDFLAPLPHKPMVVTRASLDGTKQQVDPLETVGVIVTEVLDPTETVVPSQAGIPPERIGGYTPRVTPLPSLDFGPHDVFEPLLRAPQQSLNNVSNNNHNNNNPASIPHNWTDAEAQVVNMFQRQACCVKTIKNNEWGALLHRFCYVEPPRGRRGPTEHDDIPPNGDNYPFNSFVTSTSLLPRNGLKMRSYGSSTAYTVGVVFALPDHSSLDETEDEAQIRTRTWSWPAGYAAKTEFNIDSRGQLQNGRQEALVSLSVLRQYNNDYLTKDSYMIGTRFIENAGLKLIPYNEVFLRVGGCGRVVSEVDAVPRRFDRGVGLPVALFVRTATFGDLIALLRARARMLHTLGEQQVKGIPLLLVTPEEGVRVLTESLQKQLWQIAARALNPFQNQAIAHKTTVTHTEEASFQQKVDELLDLDETMQAMLTPEELARIAGGFGATDESVATILRRAMAQDQEWNEQQEVGDCLDETKKKHRQRESHKLQDTVNEGLSSALRSGDYHTSRQLLILYSLVASTAEAFDQDDDGENSSSHSEENGKIQEQTTKERPKTLTKRASSLGRNTEQMKKDLAMVRSNSRTLSTGLPAPPPPPPLDTDRLRRSTNSDGLLAVLGAAQVLKAMQDGGAKTRTQEVIDAVDEWVNYGEQSVAFRISSWYDQRAAQGDLKINTENNSSFMAFVSNKAISNRKAFVQQLRDAAASTDFTDMRFLQALDNMLKKMHSPCLRLELLQYVLGLDNRYSVAHVSRSVELAATCLDISQSGR